MYYSNLGEKNTFEKKRVEEERDTLDEMQQRLLWGHQGRRILCSCSSQGLLYILSTCLLAMLIGDAILKVGSSAAMPSMRTMEDDENVARLWHEEQLPLGFRAYYTQEQFRSMPVSSGCCFVRRCTVEFLMTRDSSSMS